MSIAKVTSRSLYQFIELTPVMVKFRPFPCEPSRCDPVLAGLQRKKDEAENVLNAYYEYLRSHP